MLAVWRHRRLAAALGAMLLGAGCASAPARATGDAQFVESSRENECEQSARTASGRTGTWADVAGSGLFATLLGALEGALKGVTSSTWRGTHVGIRKAREAQAVYLVAYQNCMVEAPAPVDPTLLTDGGE